MTSRNLRTRGGGLPLACVCAAILCGCAKEPTLTTSSTEALRLYQDGASQYEKFYYREAKASLERAIGFDSSFAMAWARLAAVDMNNQDEPQALTEIGRAMQLMGHASRREQLIIRMLDRRFHYDYGAAARIADSISLLYPDEKEAYVIRGLIDQTGNDYEAALRSYRKAVEVDTGYAIAYMYIGYAYSSLGEQDEALSNMEHYIRLAPDAADPRASYGDLLMRVGRYDEALEQYQKALALKPDYWYSFMQIGNIYAIEGRLHDAEVQFHKSLSMRPPNRALEATHLVVAAALDRFRAKYKEAVELYASALSLDSTNGGASFGLVYCLGRLHRTKEAWSVVDRIYREFGRRNLLATSAMLEFHLVKANLLKDERRYDQALVECDSAKEYADPLTRGLVYRYIADIDFLLKHHDDALDASEEALRVNPDEPEALLNLVRIYHATGDRDLTSEIGGRLMEFWKNADPDFSNLAELKGLLRATGRRVSVTN